MQISNRYKVMGLVMAFFVLNILIAVVFSQLSTRVMQGHLSSAQAVEDKFRLLSAIKARLGYGHFIHDYKNLVLRCPTLTVPEQHQLLAQVERDYRALHRLFRQYLAAQTGELEQSQFRVLEQTVEQYHHHAKTICELYQQGKTIAQVDALVKVNDRPAKTALSLLDNYLQDASLALNQSTQHQIQVQNLVLLLSVLLLNAGLFWFLYSSFLKKDVLTPLKNLKRFKEILDHTQDMIWIFDSQTFRFHYANQAALNNLQYPMDDLMAMKVTDMTPQFNRENYRKWILPLLNGEVPVVSGEIDLKRRSGETFPVEVFVQLVKTQNNEQFVAVLRDMTELRQAHRTLKTEMDLREAILNTANLSIISTDIHGVIQTMNPQAEEMTGYTADALVGKSTPLIWHKQSELDEAAQRIRQRHGLEVESNLQVMMFKSVQESEEEREWTYVKQDGSEIVARLTLDELRDEQGQVYGYLGISKDVSDEKRFERMKTEFLSTVSHELRTPLTSINGALSLLLGKDEAAKVDTEHAQRLLRIARRNGERLLVLINDLLDFEKLESGKMEYRFAPMLLNGLLHQALEDNQGYAMRHGIELIGNRTHEAAWVIGDEYRLLQVMSNLISNAVKFSPPNGRVEIGLRSLPKQPQQIRVFVKDYGRGIPESFQPMIFHRFAQADSSDSREKGGTGLGLSICQAIIHDHQGTIDFTTRVGHFTEFYFDLALYDPSQAESESSSKSKSD